MLKFKGFTAQFAQFQLTGQSAALKKGYVLTGDYRQFQLVEQDANLGKIKSLTANSVTLHFNGQTANLTKNKVPLTAGSRLLNLTGQAAAFRRTYRLTAAPSTFVMTKMQANLLLSTNPTGFTTLQGAINSLQMGAKVELFQVDLSPIGYNIQYYFTPSSQSGYNLVYDGITYVPRAVQAQGFEMAATEGPPSPTFAIGNVDKGGNAILEQYGDLLGAKITRIVTFKQFLDTIPETGAANPQADPTAHLLPEIWYLEQKQAQTRISIQWSMKSALDLDGRQVPQRLVLKNVCQRVYRRWDAGSNSFIYSTKNACPYAGGSMFKRDGTTTADPTLDACSKDFTGCQLRFGNAPLPGWFFPGVSRIPQR